jgi:hypothetical protein
MLTTPKSNGMDSIAKQESQNRPRLHHFVTSAQNLSYGTILEMGFFSVGSPAPYLSLKVCLTPHNITPVDYCVNSNPENTLRVTFLPVNHHAPGWEGDSPILHITWT